MSCLNFSVSLGGSRGLEKSKMCQITQKAKECIEIQILFYGHPLDYLVFNMVYKNERLLQLVKQESLLDIDMESLIPYIWRRVQDASNF